MSQKFSLSLFHTHTHTHTLSTAQQITQPPVNTTAALGTNATFSCSGVGDQIFWEVSNTQIITSDLVMNFASQVQVYAPLPTDQGYSELFVMATIGNNASLPIRCNVGVGNAPTGNIVESNTVFLTVYGKHSNHNFLFIDQ